MIVYIPNGEVDRMVFVLTGCNGDGCFVASKYDGDEEGTMRVNVDRDSVLFMEKSACVDDLYEAHLRTASRTSPLT